MFTNFEIENLKALKKEIENQEPGRSNAVHTLELTAFQMQTLYKAIDSVIDVFEDDAHEAAYLAAINAENNESDQRIERMLEKQDAERGADDYEPSEE